MKIGCSETKPTYPSLLWPAEWKKPAPLSILVHQRIIYACNGAGGADKYELWMVFPSLKWETSVHLILRIRSRYCALNGKENFSNYIACLLLTPFLLPAVQSKTWCLPLSSETVPCPQQQPSLNLLKKEVKTNCKMFQRLLKKEWYQVFFFKMFHIFQDFLAAGESPDLRGLEVSPWPKYLVLNICIS